MVDILHRVGITSSVNAAYKALSTREGLAAWWTGNTQVAQGPAEWVGTRIRFDLQQSGEHTVVLFRHQGWKEPVEFMPHCSTKWAIYLMSLKSLVETGTGTPNPNDPHISGDGAD